jgi:7,8-dihydropterin-6-yl-methyl-4-(beta-D-ribofuranosyl)aminobenzene 5'-phosphate synthase
MEALDGFESEHGLSFLIEVDHKLVLFDTGASDLFIRNASRLGVDMKEVDLIILSHGHWDHGNGLQYMKEKPLFCHPGCFVQRYRKSGNGFLGLPFSQEEAAQRFDLQTSHKAIKLLDHLWFLGEIPRKNDFEGLSTKYVLEDGSDDFIMDDSGLAVVTKNGLVVVSGCAHSGITNMIEHARQVTGVLRIAAVIGGFHLRAANIQTNRTIAYLKKLEEVKVFPSHCTVDPALNRFKQAFGSREVLAGACLTF